MAPVPILSILILTFLISLKVEWNLYEEYWCSYNKQIVKSGPVHIAYDSKCHMIGS